MRTQTLAFPDVFAMTNNRVAVARFRTASPQDVRGWKMPTSGIVYRAAPGPIRREFQAPIRWQPVQVECYGADERLADALYRILWPSFQPQDMLQPHSFKVASMGVSIMGIQELSAAYFEYDRDTAWPRVIGQWWVGFS